MLKPAYISYSSDLSESVDGRGGLAESSLRAVPAARVRRSSHHDQSRQNVEENDADPPRHPVSPHLIPRIRGTCGSQRVRGTVSGTQSTDRPYSIRRPIR